MNIDSLNLTWDFVVASDANQGAPIGTNFLVKYGVVLDLRKKNMLCFGEADSVDFQGKGRGSV
jgi:hypothetical protein